MQENYKILGVSENATKEEITAAYTALKEKYSKERFFEGEIGNEAAKRLTQVENAYAEIMSNFTEDTTKQSYGYANFALVEQALKDGKLDEAQRLLDDISDRNAEWHYLQSVVFYKKSWLNESKKQLEIAMEIEPSNRKYSDAYTKLKQKIEFTNQQFYSGNANPNQTQNAKQMGGDGANDCLSFCATWCCIDMMCSICCR